MWLYLPVMIHNVKFGQIYLFFIVLTCFFSCTNDERPDVSDIDVNIKIERFDKDLYAGISQAPEKTDALLANRYGNFYDDFTHKMVGNANTNGIEMLSSLYADRAYADLNAEVDSVYPNLDKQEQQLTTAFKYIKYYYPKAEIPRFIGFLSGFAYQTPIGDGYMGIGLDMFLGADSKFYGALTKSIPLYLSRRFTPEFIAPRVTEYYIRESLVREDENDRSLLAKMIYNGKMLYFLDQILPENTPDSIKIAYTGKQMAWANNFEGNIWAYYLQNNLIYETDFSKIQVFLADGPFTPGLGEKNSAPPRLGVYTGWQIVRQYMANNPQVTLQQLMAEKDAQKILTAAKYKPKEQ